MLRACAPVLFAPGWASPILLGDRTKIKEAAQSLNVSLEGVRIINPADSEDLDGFARRFEALRRFKGMKSQEAREAMLLPTITTGP